MATARQLTTPPIQEAVIDFAFSAESATEQQLAQIADEFAEPDWKRKTVNTFQATFGPLGDDESTTFGVAQSDQIFSGFALTSPDERLNFVARAGRVTVSVTKSYGSWEELHALAGRALASYNMVVKDVQVTRVGVRYINRLAKPDLAVDFPSMLAVPPAVAVPYSFGKVTDFVRTDVINAIEGDLTANFTLATVLPLPGEPGPALLVDIDVFKMVRSEPTLAAVDETLNQIRNAKNRLFFESLTEASLERYT